ncbi:DHA2 family efflux MFS transporter permease subunit [Nocardia sp. NPDC050697]|uniref:DHA2 family efflux MFS transporter permease subunit n=1 Tax=Nocardia sp. NPDC050697 TaxID=3155158 RepID=UPI0033C492D3
MTAIALGVLIVSLDGTITAVANPVLARELGATLSDLQWITTIYLLAMAATLVLAGKLGDRFGRRTVFLTGVAGFGVSSAVIACAPVVAVVIAGRLGQGIFGALIVTNALALLRVLFTREALPKALSLFASLIGASSAAGPLIGGLLIEQASWRSAFLINVPVVVVSLVIGVLVLPRHSRPVPARFDLAGAALLGIGLLASTYGVIRAPEVGWTNTLVLTLFVVGLAAAVLFVVVENRAADPVIPIRLFADPSIAIGIVLTVISFFALVGSLFFVLLYLQQINGDSPLRAGLHLLPLSIANVAASSASGWILRHRGPRLPLVAGMLLSAVGFALFTDLPVHSGYLTLALPFIALGLGLGLVMTASVQAVLGNAESADAGAAAGTHQTALQIGGILGTSVLGAVMAAVVAGRFGTAMSEAEVPGPAAESVSGQAASAVAQGVAPVLADAPQQVNDALRTATEVTFVHGMGTTMWVGVGISLLGAVLALGIRRGRVLEHAAAMH